MITHRGLLIHNESRHTVDKLTDAIIFFLCDTVRRNGIRCSLYVLCGVSARYLRWEIVPADMVDLVDGTSRR